jgi:DNA polymerase I
MRDPLAQFERIVLGDTEYISRPGERPIPVCIVLREFRTKETIRLWHDELGPRPPHSTGPDTLFVAYYAPAEMGFYRVCDWRPPERILDIYIEYRNRFNCLPTIVDQKLYEEDEEKIKKYSLVGALTQFDLPTIGAAKKEEMRKLIQGGGPWTPDEKKAILDYCESDVVALDRLLIAMLPQLDVSRALFRGRYTPSVAAMEHNGIPIDVELHGRVDDQWESIQQQLITRIDAPFGVYEETAFRTDRFERYLAKRGIPWPHHPSGKPILTEQVFRDMAKLHPEFNDLRELRSSLSEIRKDKLTIGSDGRNRCPLWAFSASSSRNQPSSTEYIFGPAKWKRGFIKPPPGYSVGYVDICNEEFGVGAGLSGDRAMQAAYTSGDPYLEFAKAAKAVPANATRKTHGHVRDLYKLCVLGVGYGIGEHSLALRTDQPVLVARSMLRHYRETFPRFWEWSTNRVRNAMLTGSTYTVFGWTYHVTADANVRSIRNFPMQANAAEILRLAICLGVENGIRICAPVHDAVLIESPIDELDSDIARMRGFMAEASRVVLNGFELRTEYVAVRYPDRYMDPRGRQFWNTVMSLL